MARPEVEPKTPLGRRIRAVRAHFGEDDRDAFAERLGISKGALAHYERGERVPDASVLASYREVLGINLAWLVAEIGGMFDDPTKAPAPSITVDPWAMGRAYSAAERVCKEIGRPVTSIQLAEEAATIYSKLLGRIADVRDRPMVEAALSVLAKEEGADDQHQTGPRQIVGFILVKSISLTLFLNETLMPAAPFSI